MVRPMRTPEEHAERGRQLVQEYGLLELRNRLGFSRSAMCELLHLATRTYRRCEEGGPGVAGVMWQATAERIGRFAFLADLVLDELQHDGVDLADLTPMHMVATTHGLPQELLLQWYREGVIQAEDLGVLGLWIHKDDLHLLNNQDGPV